MKNLKWIKGKNDFKYSFPKTSFGSLNIIDQFDGKEMIFISDEIKKNGESLLSLSIDIILDSNAVTHLSSLYGNKEPDPKIIEFLDIIFKRTMQEQNTVYHFNTVYYIVENFLQEKRKGRNIKNNLDSLIENTAKVIAINYSDPYLFLNERKLTGSLDEIIQHNTSFEGKTPREIAKQDVTELLSKDIRIYEEYIDNIYLILLNIALIYKKHPNLDKSNRFNEFLKWQDNCMGMVSNRETILALFLFASENDKTLSYLHLKKKINKFKEITNDIYNTAIDLSMLRSVEIELIKSEKDNAKISYVATSEKKLISYSKLLFINCVFDHKDIRKRNVGHEINYDGIEHDIYDSFLELYDQYKNSKDRPVIPVDEVKKSLKENIHKTEKELYEVWDSNT